MTTDRELLALRIFKQVTESRVSPLTFARIEEEVEFEMDEDAPHWVIASTKE